MAANVETLGSLERRLSVSGPMDEVEQQFDERLRKIARGMRMHGFRPGKVPMKLVAQQYGPQVRSEVIGDAVQKAFEHAVNENKLRVAGNPRIESKDAGDASQLAFSATFEVYPEVSLGDIGKAKVEKPRLQVGDADVDKTIEILRKQRATFEPAQRAAQNGD